MPVKDSQYTDPDALRNLYRNPRNPLREAELSGVPTVPPPAPPIPPVLPPRGGHCPAMNQYIIVRMSTDGGGAKPVLVHLVREHVDFAWDAITNTYSRIKRKLVIDDVPCVRVLTDNGAEQIVSTSHPIIQHFEDQDGSPIHEFIHNPRITPAAVSCIFFQPQQTYVTSIESAGKRTIVALELENGKRYASGSHPDRLIMGHNKELPTDLDVNE